MQAYKIFCGRNKHQDLCSTRVAVSDASRKGSVSFRMGREEEGTRKERKRKGGNGWKKEGEGAGLGHAS
jgi:hypothetical protein